MASRIKGITIEIGADTVGLEGALRDVNQRSKDLQKELKDVERLLKFDPNNTELLAQRQQILTQSVAETTTKLNQLRAAEAQVQAQFEAGTIGEEQYRGFRRELQQTEQQLQGYQQSLVDMDREQERVGQGTRQLGAFFDATGTSVQDYANVIGNRLVTAIQNGSATSRDLEYAFQRIGRQAIGTNGDIERLRTTLASVDSGNSIQAIRRDLQLLQQEAEQTAESVDGIGDSLQTVAGALVAGGGIAGAVQQALDTSSIDTKIKISMEIPPESVASVKEAVRQVEAYGVDGEAALEGVRRQWALNKDATDEQNAALVKMAGTVAASFAGVDFNELIQETNEIAASLKITNEDAIALTNALLKAGFPPEQLDTISEYGTQMQLAGFNAKEIQAIFEAGIDTKTWNIDNLNDGVKEARLTMSGFGLEVPKALKPLIEDAGISAKQFQEWGKAVAAGGEEGSKAMSDVATWLDSIDNKELKNELATKVFGTKWEDQGANMISVFQGVATAADKTTENTLELQSQVDTLNADPVVQFKTAMNDLKTALEPVLLIIADLVSKIAEWVSNNPQLAATIVAITTAVGILIGIFLVLSPIIAAISTLATALGVSVGAILLPVLAVIAGVAALIAIGILLYKNWDEIKAKAIEIWGAISEWFSQTWQQIKQGASDMWTGLSTWFSETWTSIKTKAVEIWTGIKEWFKTTWESIKQSASEKFEAMKSTIQEKMNAAKSKIAEIWNGIKSSFSNTVGNMVSAVKEKFQNIVDSIRDKMNSARDTVEGIVDKIKGFFDIDLYDSGKAIIQSAIDGLVSMKKKILGKVEDIVGAVRDFWPFSPAKRGPLSDIHKMDFAGPIGDSIMNAQNPLESAMSNLASRVSNSMSGMTEITRKSASVGDLISSVSDDSRSGQQPVSFNIQPANVYLDKDKIGEIMFEQVDSRQVSNIELKSLFRGDR